MLFNLKSFDADKGQHVGNAGNAKENYVREQSYIIRKVETQEIDSINNKTTATRSVTSEYRSAMISTETGK